MLVTLGLKALGLLGFIKPSLGKGWTDKAARVAGIVVLAVLALILFGVGKCTYDQGVIDDFLGEQAVEDLKARDEADENAAPRESQNAEDQAALAEAAAEAKANDPKKGKSTVGPVTQSYYDNLPED